MRHGRQTDLLPTRCFALRLLEYNTLQAQRGVPQHVRQRGVLTTGGCVRMRAAAKRPGECVPDILALAQAGGEGAQANPQTNTQRSKQASKQTFTPTRDAHRATCSHTTINAQRATHAFVVSNAQRESHGAHPAERVCCMVMYGDIRHGEKYGCMVICGCMAMA
jgi:hypothetical protein